MHNINYFINSGKKTNRFIDLQIILFILWHFIEYQKTGPMESIDERFFPLNGPKRPSITQGRISQNSNFPFHSFLVKARNHEGLNNQESRQVTELVHRPGLLVYPSGRVIPPGNARSAPPNPIKAHF